MTDQSFSEWLDANQQSTDSVPLPALMSRKQAAEYLGVKEQTLACWTTTKRYALPYIKVGRLVKYRRTDLERFITENCVGVASA